ncbi:hypothetical protein G6F68_020064 [Rhizopus microsporus]|nr:hypothetical protein G6F68_020064 [Rhizopus microsporus]
MAGSRSRPSMRCPTTVPISKAHCRDLLDADVQAIEGHGDAQEAPRGEVHAHAPIGRHRAAQEVAVQHAADDAHDQRGKTQLANGGQVGQLHHRTRHQANEQHPV